ncbi:MAG: hypothetical protein QXR17_08015 [Candidatus Bathyarchaeia archaeon]
MATQGKIGTFKPKSFTEFYLSGVCRCGKQFNAFVELPQKCLVTVEGRTFELPLAEHAIVLCPFCGRLLNLGNGSRRARQASKHVGVKRRKWLNLCRL